MKILIQLTVVFLTFVSCKNSTSHSESKSISAKSWSKSRYIYPYVYSEEKTKNFSLKKNLIKNAFCLYEIILSSDSLLLTKPILRFREARSLTVFAIDHSRLRAAMKLKPGTFKADENIKISSLLRLEKYRAKIDDSETNREESARQYAQALDENEVSWAYIDRMILKATSFEDTSLFKCPINHPNAH